MAAILQTILTTSFHGSIVILAVLLLRLVLKKAPKKFICLLWMLAGIRLLLPIPLESAYSLQPESIAIPIPETVSRILPILWVAIALVIGAYSLGSYIHLRRKVMDAVKIPGSKPPSSWASSSPRSTYPRECPGRPGSRSWPMSGPTWTRATIGSK